LLVDHKVLLPGITTLERLRTLRELDETESPEGE
jgi:hypothetical protein